jgi:hypothetical protein
MRKTRSNMAKLFAVVLLAIIAEKILSNAIPSLKD